MTIPDDLTGYLLLALPATAHTPYTKGVMLVTSHWPGGSYSCMINRPFADPSYGVTRVMQTSGIDYKTAKPLFCGGLDEPNRIQVVHTLDWQCSSTKIITNDIGVTQELSVLTAIAEDSGPDYWRCLAGYRATDVGQLEAELQGLHPYTPKHSWLLLPATVDLVFNSIGDDQWIKAIDQATRLEVSNWF